MPGKAEWQTPSGSRRAQINDLIGLRGDHLRCPAARRGRFRRLGACRVIRCAAVVDGERGATAVVMTLEAWAKFAKPGEKFDMTEAPSEAFDRREFVVLMGESHGGQK